MNSSSQVVEWQNPFVDVFKYYNVFDGSGHDKKGNINILQDNSIGRRVFKVQGSISATNYVQFPPAKSGIQTLGLNGKYIYIELLPAEFLFSIHLDFTITKRNPVRFTISNMYESYKVSSNTLQVPFPRDLRNQWVVLCIDVEQHLEKFGLIPPGTFKSFSKVYILKSVQICSTITLRGIYTSDNRYNSTTIPREMDFKMPKGKWEDVYAFIYLPESVELAAKKNRTDSATRKGRSILKKTSSLKDSARSASSGDKNKSKSKGKSPSPKKAAPPKEQLDETQPLPVQPHEKLPEKPPVRPEERAKIPWYRPPTESVTTYVDQKNSLLSLDYVLGFTGRRCPDVKWSQDPERQEEILFASGKLVVGYNTETADQRFFVGSTSAICCLDLSRDGSRVVVAQEDHEPSVRVFNYRNGKCLGTIPINMKEIRSVSISYNRKYVSVTGVDNYNRDVINIWDLEALETRNKAELVAKQMSEFNILTCKFSPIESDKLVSCGRENIRFWRIKGDHLAGGAVVLNQHARDTVFTVLDFDFKHENPATALTSDTSKRVFVGTKHGLLFQVNYVSRQLEGVIKLHDSCICSLSISAGFCVTGSEDQYLRVWPLDFSEYFLEAKHEGIVIALDISHDALKVAYGISSGGLGMIDLSNQSHRTMIRAHTDTIKKIDYHAFSNCFITLSEDLTIRVWDTQKLEQMYEFTYSKEDPCTCISSTSRGLYFAAGFQSGILRIFDIEKTCIVEESKFHNSPMNCVLYSPDGKYLVTADQQGNYNLFDVERGLQPVKVFEAEIENDNPIAAFTNDSATLATTGAYANHINLWDMFRFFRRGRIIVKGSTVKALKFSSDDLGLFVLLNDGKIKLYGVRANEPVLLKDITSGLKVTSSSLDCSVNNQYVVTGGDDSKIRVWDIFNAPGENKRVFPQEGHVDQVRATVFSNDGTKVITASHDEGVYVWSFKGDMEPIELFAEDLESFSSMLPGRPLQGMTLSRKDEEEVDKLGNEIFEPAEEEHKSPYLSEERKKGGAPNTPPKSLQRKGSTPMKEITNLSPHVSRNKVDFTEDGDRSEKTQQVSLSPLESRTQAFLKSPKSAALRKTLKFKKPPVGRGSPSPTKTAAAAAERAGRKYVKTALRRNNKLPFKHYALESDCRLAEAKSKAVYKTRNKLELEYILGYNNDAHNNIVWNIPGGWFAYGSENYLVIEQLISERSQKVITFPEFVSCLALSSDHSLLAVGSATYDSNIYSNIHIIDCYTFKIVRTLKFHNKGVQALTFSPDNKYLVSAGNYRECTIAVWDPNNGQLIASSYTLTNINEVRVKPYTRSGILEFTTVGADQVIQWILTNDAKLLNSESFIQSKSSKNVEITAFNYVLVNDRDYILMGTTEGEIMLFDLSSGEMELRKKACGDEVVDIITNNNELRAVITSLDSNVYTWSYNDKLKFDDDSNFKHTELKFPATCIYMDDTLNEGLLGTMDGGILYANFKEDLFSKLVGASSVENYVVRVKELDENIFATFHAFGGVKLWSAFTGEELVDISYAKISCKDVLLHKGRGELFCFYDDNSCRIVDMNNFDKVTSFILDEFTAQPGQTEGPRYIADSQMIHEQGQAFPYYLAVTNRGEMYVSELREKDEVVWVEAMEQTYTGTLAHFNAHSKTKVLNICFNDATIQTLAFYRGNHTYPDIGVLDQWNLMDDPHGDLDKNEEARLATLTIYGTKVQRNYRIATAFTDIRGVYYVITNYLQYVTMRNSINREILRRISLESFPSGLYFEPQTKNVIVGLDDGYIVYYDENGKELQRQRNFNDGAVIGFRISKNEDQKKLIAIEQKAMTIYKCL